MVSECNLVGTKTAWRIINTWDSILPLPFGIYSISFKHTPHLKSMQINDSKSNGN